MTTTDRHNRRCARGPQRLDRVHRRSVADQAHRSAVAGLSQRNADGRGAATSRFHRSPWCRNRRRRASAGIFASPDDATGVLHQRRISGHGHGCGHDGIRNSSGNGSRRPRRRCQCATGRNRAPGCRAACPAVRVRAGFIVARMRCPLVRPRPMSRRSDQDQRCCHSRRWWHGPRHGR